MSRRAVRWRVLSVSTACLGVVAFSCTGDDPDRTGSTTEPTIYGDDDRGEYTDFSEGSEQRVWLDATALVTDSSAVTCNGQTCQLSLLPFNDPATRYCDGPPPFPAEPFSRQDKLNAGSGTGFLVGRPDLVLTAEHVLDALPCANMRVIFDYHVDQFGSTPIVVPAASVKTCAEVVARGDNSQSGTDWALIRLNSEMPRVPFVVRRENRISVGAVVIAMGHPDGLPVKLVEFGTVTSNPSSDTLPFQVNLDMLEGNSGSPIMDPSTRLVEGLEVDGNADFISAVDLQGPCLMSFVCSEASGCPGGLPFELATRTVLAAGSIPLTPTEIVSAVQVLTL